MPLFLTFGVEQEVFAIPVASVQEIQDLRPMSRLPYAPPEISGLIEVRGRSVTVIDLRVKLGLAVTAATDASRIIILDADNTGTDAFGLVADRVFEVTDLDAGCLEAAPDLGARWDHSCIAGIGRWRDGFVIALDVDHLLRGNLSSPVPRANVLESAL